MSLVIKDGNGTLRTLDTITDNLGVQNPVQLTKFADSPSLDAFARLRTSAPFTVFDSKQIHDNLPNFYDDQETSGSGTGSTHSANRASSTLSVSNLTAGTRVRQTFRRFNYQSGKSQLGIFTFVFGAKASGITRRRGYFDGDDGVFFEQTGSDIAFVVRSNATGTPVDTRVPQSSWNVDKLDGTGSSGITFDDTKSQILFIDFEWLGVGRIRYGFFIDGKPYLCHEINNANNLDVVYMSKPNLPIRTEISNDGTGSAATLEEICATVISEGGQENTGAVRTQGRGVTTIDNVSTSDFTPVISVRLKSGYESETINLENLSVLCATNTNFEWTVHLNPTIQGTDNASWSAVPNSSIEYDISRDNTNNFAENTGIRIQGGLGSNAIDVIQANLDNALRLGANIAGTRDQIVVGVRSVSGATNDFLGTLTWRELS